MSSNNSAIGALILVPIFIAASAAYFALKAAELSESLARFVSNTWNKHSPWSSRYPSRRQRKLRRSNLRSSQHYSDSWLDLESIDSRQGYSRFIGQNTHRSPPDGQQKAEVELGPTQIWHPSRSTRLAWSFMNPRSPSRSLFELSSVARPSPATRRPQRLSADDADLLARPSRVSGARRSEPTGL